MPAKTYRKKPLVIEAMKFEVSPSESPHIVFGSLESAKKIREWSNGVAFPADFHQTDGSCYKMTVETLEGYLDARPGDYIIKGIKGEFYPCKPDIFNDSYEEVE